MNPVRFGIRFHNLVSNQATYQGQPVKPAVERLGRVLNQLVPGNHITLTIAQPPDDPLDDCSSLRYHVESEPNALNNNSSRWQLFNTDKIVPDQTGFFSVIEFKNIAYKLLQSAFGKIIDQMNLGK